MTDAPATLGLVADPEQINRWLADAILESQLGKSIRDKAKEALTNYKFQQEVESAIRSMVANEARNYIENDEGFKLQVREAIARSMTPELVIKLADVATAKLSRNY